MTNKIKTSFLAVSLAGALMLSACAGDEADESVNADQTNPPTTVDPSEPGGSSTGDEDPGPADPGGDTTAPGADPDDVVESPPSDTTPPGDPGDVKWDRIEQTEDLGDPQASTPEQIVVDPDDDRVVLVRFWGGVEECYAARATVVEQDDDRVVILLETGQNPDAEPDTACIAMAVAQELAVTLDSPLGDRELLASSGA